MSVSTIMMATKYLTILIKGIQKNYRIRNLEQALSLSNRALLIAKEQEDQEIVRSILITKAKIFKTKSRYLNKKSLLQEALSYLNLAKIINDFTNEQRIKVLVEIGSIYTLQKKYTEANEVIQTVIEQSLELNYTTTYLTAKLALVELYAKQKQFKAGIDLIQEIDVEQLEGAELQSQYYELWISLYINTGQFDKLSKLANELLQVSSSHNYVEGEGIAYNALAIALIKQGEFKDSFSMLMLAISKSEEIDNQTMLAKCYINLGNIFINLYSFKSAIEQFQKVEGKYLHTLEAFAQGILYFNLGGTHIELEEYHIAIEYFEKSLVASKNANFFLMVCRCYYEISNVYILLKQFDKGLEYAQKAEESYQTSKRIANIEAHLANLATIQLHKNNTETAETYALEALEISIARKNMKTVRRVHNLLSTIYEKTGNFKSAFSSLKKYSELNDNFMLQVRNRQTIDLEIRYALNEKERQIEQLTDKMKIQQLELTYQEETKSQNIKLKMANDELKNYSYAISHDLKEPLRMIGSFTKLWFKRHRHDVDERDKEYFHYITGGVDRMTIMLNGLLDYATLGQNERKTVSVNVNDLIIALQENLYVKIKETNAIITVAELPNIVTHKLLLFQLLQNLISNALKFQQPNTQPVIKIGVKEEKTQYIISVADNGIGISEKNQEAIFTIFKRLHHRDEYEGTGIGLALCKKMSQLLGGNIWLTSKEGEGSIFYFSIPKK